MEELEHCPFCGGEAIGFEWSDDDEIDEGEPHAQDAYCAVAVNHKDDCLLKVGEFYMWIAETEEEASKIWNTRAERTCENVHLFSGFRCNECKTTWHTLMRDEAGDWQKTNPKFCPNCGAKVVDDD